MCPELEGLFLRRTTFKIVVENYSVDGRDILLTTNLSRPRCSSAHLIARSKRVIFMIFMPEIVRRDVQNQCRSILPLSSESLRYSPHVEGRGCFHEGNKQVLTALKKRRLYCAQRAERTGFLMAMLLLIAMPMRSALTLQLGAQLDPGARHMTDI